MTEFADMSLVVSAPSADGEGVGEVAGWADHYHQQHSALVFGGLETFLNCPPGADSSIQGPGDHHFCEPGHGQNT